MSLFRPLTMAAGVLVAISGCATQKPVLSPNERFMRAGPSVAAQDIDDCMAYAKAGVEGPQTYKETPVASAATSSVVGAAAGGASGAVFGNAGAGAAAGAIGGAVGSIMHSLLDGAFRAKPPEPMVQQLAEHCLRQKGYEPRGWQ